ncbi:MAG: helix-turn-helix transcriptional regulator [Rhizobiales bacterium]|nr:helix-turn-helix transcriptional regulator [Hyphomicrobiales bacterium]
MTPQGPYRIVTIQTESPPSDDAPKACRPADCLAEDWLSFLGHRWNALALWQLTAGPLRFTELQAALPGITPKVLTERVAGLVARGLVLRSESNHYPREVSYSLSPRGRALGRILLDLYDWAEADAAAR